VRALLTKLTSGLNAITTRTGLLALAVGTCVAWFYGPFLLDMAARWAGENNYSHSFLVPAFAALLLWMRADRLKEVKPGLYWGGLAFFLFGALLRFAGAYIYFEWLEGISLLFYVAGIFVLLGGKPALRWSWPAIAFLVFMIPLPFRVEHGLSFPLQRFATQASTYCLQTFGVPALSEGNVIILSEVRIGIVEACNGLGMLVSFVTLAVGVALVIRRPLLDKLIIAVSSVPIAIVTNVIRITGTGVLHETVGPEIADKVFHDFAGWLMMPIALAFLWVELKILDRVFKVAKKQSPATVSPLPIAKMPARAAKRPAMAGAKAAVKATAKVSP
jgi:exosortase